ncbi:GntR family transcriptional regulator [Kitasatospora albolonga]|uniref:GntR family transcriptional regulator n=1 Tax=Kitasatospora albolonga TaxID=68173 RepID=UPI0031F127C3
MPADPVLEPVAADAGQPPYVLAQQAIQHAVATGAFGPGRRLPSERHLCEQLGISRSTLRRTLKALEEQGLVESSERRGWRVRQIGHSHAPETSGLLGFADFNRSLGRVVTARVLGTRTRPAGSEEAERLRVPTGSALFELRRLRLLDGLPICVSHDLVPLAVAPELPAADFTTASVFAQLTAAGHAPVSARYTARAALADAGQRRLLELRGPSAVLTTERLSFDEGGSPCADSHETYRADRYELRLTLGPGGF